VTLLTLARADRRLAVEPIDFSRRSEDAQS
jgi:hypothetical protein